MPRAKVHMQWASQDSNLGRQSQQIYSGVGESRKPFPFHKLREASTQGGPTCGPSMLADAVHDCPQLRALLAAWPRLRKGDRERVVLMARGLTRGR